MKKEKGKVFLWRMQKPCDNCPLSTSKEGLHLRHSLESGRIHEIESNLLAGGDFLCHQTTAQTGNGAKLSCAGALDFQHAHDIVTPYELLCRSLEGVSESKKEMFRRFKYIAKNHQPKKEKNR